MSSLYYNKDYGHSRGVAIQRRKLREIEEATQNKLDDRLELLRVMECNDESKSIDDSLLKATHLDTHLVSGRTKWVDMVDRKRKHQTTNIDQPKVSKV